MVFLRLKNLKNTILWGAAEKRDVSIFIYYVKNVFLSILTDINVKYKNLYLTFNTPPPQKK